MLKLSGIDYKKLKGKDAKNLLLAKESIRAFMIANMRALGFKWLDLEKYLSKHFPDDYLDDENNYKFIINMKD